MASHDTTGQATSAPCSRPTLTQFVGVGCIDLSNQLSKMGRRRNDGQRVIERHRDMRHFRECLDRLQTPMHDSPVLSLVEADCQMLEGLAAQCSSTVTCPPVPNRDVDQSVLLLNGEHPQLEHSIPKDDVWSLATGQLRTNWGQPTARVCLCCSKVPTRVFS